MATRLYPCTKNATVLEILAGVPKGTANNRKVVVNSKEDVTDQMILQVAQIRSAQWSEGLSPAERSAHYWSKWSARDMYRDMRSEMRKDFQYFQYLVDLYLNPEWKRLDSFDLFGWGRLQAWGLVEANDLHAGCGHTTDLQLVGEILYQQMVHTDNFYGVYFDRSSWLGTPVNCKLVTPVGSVFLSELKGLHWS